MADIDEIRDRARLTDEFSLDDYLDEMGWVMRKDTTCHTYAWLKQLVNRVADAQIIKYNNTEIPERECKECYGRGQITGVDVGYPSSMTVAHCDNCNGIGKLPPITIKQAIKKVME